MKKTDIILIYDSSFNGFLSVVYRAFHERLNVAGIQSMHCSQVGMFSDSLYIKTNDIYARRVWDSLKKKNYSALKNIYFAFLSETNGIELMLYEYIRNIFSDTSVVSTNNSEKYLMKINQMASLVSREKQRMENQIQLRPVPGDIHLAYLEPAFNVLPLLSKHFRSRSKDHPWVIFDLKRSYGIHYNGNRIEMVSTDFMYRFRKQQIPNMQEKQLQSIGEPSGNSEIKWPFPKAESNEKTFSAA